MFEVEPRSSIHYKVGRSIDPEGRLKHWANHHKSKTFKTIAINPPKASGSRGSPVPMVTRLEQLIHIELNDLAFNKVYLKHPTVSTMNVQDFKARTLKQLGSPLRNQMKCDDCMSIFF